MWMCKAETCPMLQCVPGRAADKLAVELSERLSLVPMLKRSTGKVLVLVGPLGQQPEQAKHAQIG